VLLSVQNPQPALGSIFVFSTESDKMRMRNIVRGLLLMGILAFDEPAECQPVTIQSWSETTNLNQSTDKIMQSLMRNPYSPTADSLIRFVAYTDPDKIYTYAAAGNNLSRKIHANQDPLVKVIAKLSTMKTGRMYFPFLDELYHGKLGLNDITPALKNDEKYYQLLVKTELSYADRISKNDIPIQHDALARKLKQKAVEVYVNEINGLHNSPDNIRFRKIQGLSPVELYYLAVMGADDIYTSSYLGVYKRIMERMKGKNTGDELLQEVHYDRFKKWIKLAAGYNTLDDFLKQMDTESATSLMKNFVKGLDKTASLEDAVDVADSYASISNPTLQKLILNEVQENQKEASTEKAKHIYSLLNTIFLSKDPANNIDITAALGINPVYNMPLNRLSDAEGRVIIEQFIYGDEIGPSDFSEFLSTFRNGNWKVVSKPEWVEISSTKGKKVMIYANKPLDNKKDLDAKAQANLNDYLYKNHLYPTIAIHRGHSYHVRSTIEQLPSSSKVVLLGSCGGYQNLSDVLKASPQAHIIATKQTGTATVTQPLINIITENLREGNDLDWPAIWVKLGERFKDKNSKDKFEDYVPPYKNLGAIFMIAYNKLNEG
jgi:hypothetical protein